MDAYCSLKTTTPQPIPAGVWTLVQFVGDVESGDDQGWHVDSGPASTSGLIVPTVTSVGLLAGMAQFGNVSRTAAETVQASDSGTQRKAKDAAYDARVRAGQTAMQFARDPLGAPDTTATQDHANTNGSDCLSGTWPLVVRTGQALGLRVYTSIARDLTVAEFKVWVP